jgi:hypothetical protein
LYLTFRISSFEPAGGTVPASKEQKEQAKEFLDLIKKSKGSLKVYFAVGKGSDGPAVHIDKKKPKFCVTTLKAKRVTTMLAFGQVKMEDELTLYCLKPPNENATKKTFFQFFKESEVSIPGVTESKIRVLGPKEWDSAAEDEDAEGAPSETASAQPTSAPPPPPPPPPPDQRAILMQEYQKLLPQLKEKAAAVPALQDRLKEAAGRFGNLLSSAQFEKAREALADLTNLIQGAAPTPAPAAKEEANQLFAAYQKLVPEMNRKGAEQAGLRAPLTQAAKAFQDALKAGRLDEAKRMLDQLAQILATPAPAAAAEAPPADGLGQEFANRYAALKPRLEQAIRENRGDTGKMRAGVQFAVEAANQKEFAKALKAMEQLERLVEDAKARDAVEQGLKTRPVGQASESEATETEETEDAAGRKEFEQRFAAADTLAQELLKKKLGDASQMRMLIGLASEKAGAGEFTTAINLVSRLEDLIEAAEKAPVTEPQPYPGLVKYRTALVEFAKAKTAVGGQLETFCAAVRKTLPEEADLADEVAARLDEFNDELALAVDNAMGEAEDVASPVTDAVRAELKKYLEHVHTDGLIKLVDKNPFSPVSIETTLGDALAKINEAMPAMAAKA